MKNQEGRDGDENLGYIMNMYDSVTAGFKSFECKDVKGLAVYVRGYMGGIIEIRDEIDGPVLAHTDRIPNSNVWERYEMSLDLPDGIHDIYVTYRGDGKAMLKSIEFIK